MESWFFYLSKCQRMLDKNTLQIIAALSFMLCVACGLSLYAGACGGAQNTPDDDFLFEFVSDKLYTCMHSNYLGANILPWLFVLAVFTQVVTLWFVWIAFVHCELHLKLTFHFLLFHTVFSVACVVEFTNAGVRKSAFNWFGAGRVEEQFLHVFFAVNAIIDFFLLHLCVVYAYWMASTNLNNSSFKTMYVLDILTYFFSSLIFFMLWLGNADTAAALLEWTVLIIASSLNFWAVMLLPKQGLGKSEHERVHSAFFWVGVLLALILINMFGLYASAPPSFLHRNAGGDVLTSSTTFVLIVTTLSCAVAYEFVMYLLM